MIEIDKAILNNTNACGKNFECLKNENHIYCKVESCVSDKVHFVKCKSENSCNYKISFADSFVCNCPTRKEIFNKYGF